MQVKMTVNEAAEDHDVEPRTLLVQYLREACGLVAEHGEDAKFLAGGMSLLPLMKLRLATPSVVVDVGRVRDLSYVRDGGDHVAIGALTRHRDLETNDMLAEECGVVRAVA